MNETDTARPWYTEPMVWLAIAIPATSVVVGIAFLTTAIMTWDGLVVDDYYRQGKEINQILARDQQARNLGLSAVLSANESNSKLRISIAGFTGSNPVSDESIQLRFVHRTRSEFDSTHQLYREAGGDYLTNGSIPTEGLWNVIVETPSWRLMRKGLMPIDQQTELSGITAQ